MMYCGELRRAIFRTECASACPEAEGGAIQVTGCDGTSIAGHVPVGRDLLEAAEVLATEALDSES